MKNLNLEAIDYDAVFYDKVLEIKKILKKDKIKTNTYCINVIIGQKIYPEYSVLGVREETTTIIKSFKSIKDYIKYGYSLVKQCYMTYHIQIQISIYVTD